MADDSIVQVWNMMEKIGTCMLITWDGKRQRARPMHAFVRPAEHAVYFLTDANSEKDREAEKYPVVTLAFADPGSTKFVSVSGRAVLSDNRARIRDLWNPIVKAWWASPDDPAICLLKVEPEEAELWDSPGKLITAVKMLTAAATGKRPPDVGDNRRVEM